MEVKNVILPSTGEFGLKIMYHVPAVAALEDPKVVYCEPGEEALYPSADRLITVRPPDDRDRAGTYPRREKDRVERYRTFANHRWPGANIVQTNPRMPMERFVPEPLKTHGLTPDVVVCPRKREYGETKNWDGWPELTERLSERYEVHAAGAPDSSYDVHCLAAWEYDRFLDASIEMIRNAKLVVSTDAGLAHLAVLCGADIMIVTYRGLVAPGPVIDSSGNQAYDEYWPAGLGPGGTGPDRFRSANHMGAKIEYVDGWGDVDLVVDAVEAWLLCS